MTTRTASDFLIASRQAEIAELEQLARDSGLVEIIGRFIHALQRERGLSNLYLGSQGEHGATLRLVQVAQCEAAVQDLRDALEAMEPAGQRPRDSAWLGRIALVLHGLEALPGLRERIGRQTLTAAQASAEFGKLIAGLLGLVFEAADSATDPAISRALVARFHFLQSKEFAGQERAFGARTFATGRIDAEGQQHWRHLVESQQACLSVFAGFCGPALARAELASREPGHALQIEQLRRQGLEGPPGERERALGGPWYEACTRRLDAMHALEERLAQDLRRLCERRIAQARLELRDQREALDRLLREARPADPQSPALLGPGVERGLPGMLQAQALRLQQLADELAAVRASLQERKLIDRAKGLLLAHRQLGEDEAHRLMRQMAMNQGRRLVDVAQAIVSMAEVLPR